VVLHRNFAQPGKHTITVVNVGGEKQARGSFNGVVALR
jgi:hypothetical protein